MPKLGAQDPIYEEARPIAVIQLGGEDPGGGCPGKAIPRQGDTHEGRQAGDGVADERMLSSLLPS
jgi:hypothetical protein